MITEYRHVLMLAERLRKKYKKTFTWKELREEKRKMYEGK